MEINFAGVYFISDDNSVRIGQSKNIKKRLGSHRSSRLQNNIICVLRCDNNEQKFEEKLAQEYFKDYHIKNSFYSIEIVNQVRSYVSNREIEKLDLKKSGIERNGKVTSLFGEVATKQHLPPCSFLPNETAQYIGTKNNRKGLTPRTRWVNGKRKFLSAKAHDIERAFVKDTKQRVQKKVIGDLAKQGVNVVFVKGTCLIDYTKTNKNEQLKFNLNKDNKYNM